MKKSIKIIARISIAAVMVIVVAHSYAQPNIPKKDMPPDLPAVIKKEVNTLYSESPSARAAAVFKLGEMRENAKAAVPFLVGMLADDAVINIGERSPTDASSPGEEASLALAKIGEAAAKPLITAMRDDDELVRKNASRAISKFTDPKVIKPLMAGLLVNDSYVRQNIAWTLGNLKAAEAVEALTECLKDGDWHVRRNAAWALGEIGDRRPVQKLIKRLSDSSRYVRRNSAEALVKIDDPASVAPLIKILKGDNAEAKIEAIWILGKMKDYSCAKELINIIKTDKNKTVKDTALGALKEISGQDFEMDAGKWEEWRENNIK